MARTPSLFISHGSPMVAVQEDAYTEALQQYGREKMEGVRAIVVLSAHWVSAGPVQITSGATPKTIHDFGGFPKELYEIRYPAPGSDDLAEKVSALLKSAGFETTLNSHRGWDHGAWVPLRLLRPQADLPVVQISLPLQDGARKILQLGRALSSLRDEGVLLIGSGSAVHNLGQLVWHGKDGPTQGWAVEFDTWLKRALTEAKIEELVGFEADAPHAELAHPTVEHFLPVLFTAGTTLAGDRVRMLYEGFQYGTLSMLSFELA